VRKHLILLVFISYEAVRLWWWGGNCGVVSFGKTSFFCSIPTLASNQIAFVCRGLVEMGGLSFTGVLFLQEIIQAELHIWLIACFIKTFCI